MPQSSHLKVVKQGPVVVASHVIPIIYQFFHLHVSNSSVIGFTQMTKPAAHRCSCIHRSDQCSAYNCS